MVKDLRQICLSGRRRPRAWPPSTLKREAGYWSSLVGTGRYKEAKSLLREQIAAARRALGEETSLVIRLRWNYADALHEDESASRDDAAEAVVILEELFRTARRVLGTAHPITGSIQDSLGKAQETLAAFAPETE